MDLLELAERVERLQGPCRETDALIWCALHGKRYIGHNPAWQAYGDSPLTQVEFTEPPKRTRLVSGRDLPHALPWTASLDAAMTLVPQRWNWMAGNRNHPAARAYVENGQPAFLGYGHARNPARLWFEVVAATPALALCAAALRSRAQEVV